MLDAIDELIADGVHQVLTFAVLGHKADFGVMALGPDLARLQAFQHAVRAVPLGATWSYVSLTEASKRRTATDNWFSLSFDERKWLIGGHARVGRGYAGRLLQLITGSTGTDDWEWGVTLLADDPAVLEEIVYEKRSAEFVPLVTGFVRLARPTG